MLELFRPARPSSHGDTQVVSDLDAICVKPVAIQWQGRTHVLKPITTAEFLRASEAMAKMDALTKKDKDQIKLDELVDAYANVIASVCDTITRKDVLKMSQAQVGALIQVIIDHVTGRIHAEKKSPQTPA